MKDNRKTIQVLIILTVIFTIMGSSLAYWNWSSLESQKTLITFDTPKGFSCSADGGGNITNNNVNIVPTTCTDSEYATANPGGTPRVIKRKITVKATMDNDDKKIYMKLWLNIDDIGSGLSNSVNFRYVLTTSANSCTEGQIKAQGNFNNVQPGDTVTLLNNQVYDASTTEEYWLYIWLDAAETSQSTMNQIFRFSLGGACADNKILEPLVGDAYAIYTASDSTLTFTRSETPIRAGSTYNGKTVTAAYSGFEDKTYTFNTIPWAPYAHEEGYIYKVVFEDTIRPISTANWFGIYSGQSITNLEKLDTYLVKDMSQMFYGWSAKGAGFLTVNLSALDTSNVENMSSMFDALYIDETATQSITTWDTSSVTNMSRMFANCVFHSNIANLSNWDTSNVTDMMNMFVNSRVNNANLDLSGWNVDNVTNHVGFSTNPQNIIPPSFKEAYAIFSESEQTLRFVRSSTPIQPGDVYNGTPVTEVYTGFESSTYTYDTVPWASYAHSEGWIYEIIFDDVIKPISTAYWFGMGSGDSIENLEKLDTSNVTNMEGMFKGWDMTGIGIINLDLTSLDTSQVTNMSNMFYSVYIDSSTVASIIGWDISKVTNMSNMFNNCTFDSGISGLSNWDTSNVTNMSGMFADASVNGGTLDLSDWDISKVTNYTNFTDEYTEHIIPPLFGTAYAIYTASDGVLTFVRSATAIRAGSAYNGKTVTAAYSGFESFTYTRDNLPWRTYAHQEDGIYKVVFEDTIRPISTANWFGIYSANSIENLEKLDTSKVIDMNGMFYGWSARSVGTITVDLSSLNTSNVKNMSNMFGSLYISSITASSIASWDTSSATNMSKMFTYCSIESTIANMKNWNTSNVTDMSDMFIGSSVNGGTLDLSGWNVSKVTNYTNFINASSSNIIAPTPFGL